MNFYIILHAIIGTSVVIARPVDVNNDDRPLINYISPSDADNLVIDRYSIFQSIDFAIYFYLLYHHHLLLFFLILIERDF